MPDEVSRAWRRVFAYTAPAGFQRERMVTNECNAAVPEMQF
jgi:hypothetical protein